MDECHNDDRKGDDMAMKVLAGVVSLGTILVLGGYGYTWSESRVQEQERYQWRAEHQRVLDKRFDEVKQGQEKLADKLDKNTDDAKGMLQQILNEQKRVSENIKIEKRNSNDRSR